MSNATLVYRRALADLERLAAQWRPLAAIALGLAVLYVAGFAGPERIHNAAHDARHSLNFPCH
jgi:cobalt transporter subunit CbtB